MIEEFEVRGRRAHYRPRGTVSLHDATEGIASAIARCRAAEIPEVLVDISGLVGFGAPSTGERYAAVARWAALARGNVRLAMVARAEIIDVSKLSGETIKFGATVTLIDEDTEKKTVWQLVGEPEADARAGKISITSPLARALVGKKKGAQVEVVTPGGAKAYEVLKVEWR